MKRCFFNLSGRPTKAMRFFSNQHNITIENDPTTLSTYDVVFFSLISWRDFYTLAGIRKYKGNSEWVAGGNAVTNPTGVLNLVDYCYLGDAFYSFESIYNGERDMVGMLKSSDIKPVTMNQETIYPYKISDGEIIMSSGCKRRCYFCLNPWRRSYQENDPENIMDFINNRKTKGVSLSSNSSDDVSYYESMVIPKLEERGIMDLWHANSVPGMTEEYIKSKKAPMLFGVEGMSEALRRIVNKPIKHEKLLEVIERSMFYGRQIDLMYQFNLPTETNADFQEMVADITSVKHYKTGSLGISFMPNQPSSFSPMQWEAPFYKVPMLENLLEFGKSLFGNKKTGLPMYISTPLYTKGWLQQILGEWIPINENVVSILKKIKNKKDTLENMISIFGENGMDIEYVFKEKPQDFSFPWDFVSVRASKDELWEQRNQMHKKMEARYTW